MTCVYSATCLNSFTRHGLPPALREYLLDLFRKLCLEHPHFFLRLLLD